MHKEKPILTGHCTNNGLWTVKESQHKTNGQINLVTKDGTRLQQRMEDHIRFLHAACFSPVQSTWLQAIHNNNFITWPAITAKSIAKYFKKSPATVKGHLDQLRQNIQSTQPKATETNKSQTPTSQENRISNLPTDTDSAPCQEQEKTHEVYTMVTDTVQPTNQTHSDLTGSFPHISSKGNKYLLIMYHVDANAILVEPLKSRHGPEIHRAHKTLFARFKKAGCKPKLHRLDNEASGDLKRYLHDESIDFQLVPD